MFKTFKTVRWKLTLSFLAAFAVMIVIFSVVIYNIQSSQNRRTMDRALKVLALSVAEEIQNDSLQQDVLDEAIESYVPFTNNSLHYVEILDMNGNVILKSKQLKNSVIPIGKEILNRTFDSTRSFETIYLTGHTDSLWNNTSLRVYCYPLNIQNRIYYVAAAVPLDNLENLLGNLRLIFYIAVPLMLLISSLIGWFLSKGAYRPVRQMILNANEITAENLHARLAVNESGDELAQLSVTLNRMIERLENSFLTLKQFTSDASHELKTPLTILRGRLEVAMKKNREAEEYENILKENLDEVIRLQSIVDELLILSRLESGRANISKEKVSIVELITDIVSKIDYLAGKKNIKVILDINGVENNQDAVIAGDITLLQNVFFNLLENAIKYSNENSEISCIISNNMSDKTIKVSVKDSGIGIKPEEHDKIFERFYRADSSRTRDDSISLGLGLSIARRIVELHGGRIKVQSEPGKGSIFSVILNLI